MTEEETHLLIATLRRELEEARSATEKLDAQASDRIGELLAEIERAAERFNVVNRQRIAAVSMSEASEALAARLEDALRKLSYEHRVWIGAVLDECGGSGLARVSECVNAAPAMPADYEIPEIHLAALPKEAETVGERRGFCPGDGSPCHVGKQPDDQIERCGTDQCGNRRGTEVERRWMHLSTDIHGERMPCRRRNFDRRKPPAQPDESAGEVEYGPDPVDAAIERHAVPAQPEPTGEVEMVFCRVVKPATIYDTAKHVMTTNERHGLPDRRLRANGPRPWKPGEDNKTRKPDSPSDRRERKPTGEK